ncbi:uncharacterized protein DUF2634 [Mobilisporobacter senegalensis]|uniref:Uncharacterized protein DUF2634 n=1 Tax=Mobilisporobacter senegalensis TaxID=1329262 RepID=A0A3N1XNV7_9FIRM|nr:DUF2634 domain-containing protein [Mobilisporobacter senegalensis]ROR28359.1 uncharacterized protein DUF2634 [Mobilisporobacter senegalensis]
MSFPFETDGQVSAEEVIKVPKEYGINLDTGKFTGKIVEGVEAIKIWIYNALKTSRYKYNIFSWDYGSEIEDLIGHAYTQEYLEMEAKRMVEDCLMMNQYITGISDFNVKSEYDKLSISFTANTLFGEVRIDV